jgi:TrmH family RNA methyltransferase
MNKFISSTGNSTIKKILQLQEKSRNRRKEGLFVLEGLRELRLALKGGYSISEIFFCPELISEKTLTNIIKSSSNFTELSLEVYEKIAYRGSTEGVITTVETKAHHLSDIKTSETPLILIAEAPEKPGNIGALLRTADAANVDAVIIANPKTDLYNPNIIRSSVGCVFTNQVAIGTTTEIITYLKKKKVNIYCAALQASEHYHLQDFTTATAIVVGTEATGLSEEWRKSATQNIIIPMQGEIDSMNVSVAAGILIYEAKRQRKFK